MAQPAQNTIQWIDWWVKQQLTRDQIPGPESLVQIQTYMTLTQPEQLDGWKVCRTSGNANDCMIHSLLIELSQTFQRLPPEVRDRIARTYRTTVFANINDVNRDRAQRNAFLEDPDLLAFGNYYNINILAYIPTNSEFQFVSNGKVDAVGRDAPCIIIHYNGANHYSAMLASNNNPFIEYDVASELAYDYTRKPTNLYCEYAVESLIEYERNQKKVIERRFPDGATYEGYKFCNALRLVNSNVDAFIGPGGTSWDALLLQPNAGAIEIAEDAFLTPEQGQAREQYLAAARQRAPLPGSASGPSYSGPRIGSSIPGRTSSFGPDFPDFDSDDDEPIILTNTLGTPAEQQQEKVQKSFEQTATGLALIQLRDHAIVTLNKLENFKWFFGSDIPKDCEVLKTGKFDKKIADRLKQFEDVNRSDGSPRGGGLLQKLYCGLTGAPNCPDVPSDLKAQITILLKSPEICNLANVELMLEQTKKIQTDAEEFIDGDKVDPIRNPSKWRSLLKKTKLKPAALTELIKLLIGPNKLSALQKAATYILPQDRESLLRFENVETTKYLKEFLTTYKLGGFPIQIAFDFDSVYIDDAFVKDIPQQEALKREEREFDFLNGKQFVKSMVKSMSFPTTFSLATEFVGTKLNQELVSTKEGDYYVTQKIPFLYESSQVFLSREITETVDRFEAFDKTPTDGATLSRVSLPLYIIFSCQKRKKGKDGNYLKKDGHFIYDSFHTSIIFLCDGKIYTVGYGSDPVFDEENKDTDTKIQYMNKISAFLKKQIPALANVQVLGTGFLYSPDSLNIDEDDYNYSIIDIGILKKSHVNRVNKVFAMIKRMRAITMVVDKEDKSGKSVTVEQMSAQTRCVYSRLGSKYLQNFQFSSQLMNCSSFVEAIFYDRIDCTTSLFYSDPNACKSKNFKDKIGPNGKPYPSVSALVQTIFTSYFEESTTLDSFKKLVGYVPDVPEPVSLFNKVYNFITPPPPPPLAEGGNPEIKPEIKLKKRRKHKRPKNSTAKKSSNK